MRRPADQQAPAHGARFLFELIEDEGDRARYRIEIATTGGSARADVQLGPGLAELGAFDAPVEPWAAEAALAFAKLLARGRDEETGWPRRLHRWRSPRA